MISSSHSDIVLASVSSSGAASFWAHQSYKKASRPRTPRSHGNRSGDAGAGQARRGAFPCRSSPPGTPGRAGRRQGVHEPCELLWAQVLEVAHEQALDPVLAVAGTAAPPVFLQPGGAHPRGDPPAPPRPVRWLVVTESFAYDPEANSSRGQGAFDIGLTVGCRDEPVVPGMENDTVVGRSGTERQRFAEVLIVGK